MSDKNIKRALSELIGDTDKETLNQETLVSILKQKIQNLETDLRVESARSANFATELFLLQEYHHKEVNRLKNDPNAWASGYAYFILPPYQKKKGEPALHGLSLRVVRGQYHLDACFHGDTDLALPQVSIEEFAARRRSR